jgi:hypothetical protein
VKLITQCDELVGRGKLAAATSSSHGVQTAMRHLRIWTELAMRVG